MSSYYHQKPQPVVRQTNGKPRWVSCQHTIAPPGERHYICGAPTDNNKQFCDRCAPKRLPIKSDRRDTLKTYIG